MDFSKAKIYLITEEKQRLYFTGFASSAGYVAITEDKTTFVVDSRYLFAARKRLEKKGIEVVGGRDLGAIKEIDGEVGAETIGIDFGKTTLAEFEAYKALGVGIVDVSAEIGKKMAVKSGDEIKKLEKACAIAEKSFRQAIKEIRVGMTERELAAILEYRFRMNGASDKSFDTIVAFGPNTAVPHHETGNKRLKENMPVLMDFGCIYKGYCSDMTRTFYFGTPTPEFIRAYSAVYRAHTEAYENIRAGMKGSEADKIARDVLEKEGYGKYFTHSLGHGIGVNIHEYPWVSPKSENVLEDGMIFSIEPGVYLDGKFGIRIEDSEVMKDGKPHSFMKHPKYLCVLKNGKTVKFKK